jgi:hypothetical protein
MKNGFFGFKSVYCKESQPERKLSRTPYDGREYNCSSRAEGDRSSGKTA